MKLVSSPPAWANAVTFSVSQREAGSCSWALLLSFSLDVAGICSQVCVCVCAYTVGAILKLNLESMGLCRVPLPE